MGGFAANGEICFTSCIFFLEMSTKQINSDSDL